MGEKKGKGQRQILKNKVRSSQSRVSMWSLEVGRQTREGIRLKATLTCCPALRTNERWWVCGSGRGIYPFPLGSAPPTPPSSCRALLWPQRYFRRLLEIKPSVFPLASRLTQHWLSPLYIFLLSLWSSKMSSLGFGIRPPIYSQGTLSKNTSLTLSFLNYKRRAIKLRNYCNTNGKCFLTVSFHTTRCL